MTTPDDGLIAALEPLWRIAGSEDLANDRRFKALVAYCTTRYGAEKPEWAIRHALDDLGLASRLRREHAKLAIDLPTAAAALHTAFTQRTARRRHICPLDQADELPRLRFGEAQVGRFTKDELAELFDAPRLTRTFQKLPPDIDDFSLFNWLIVDEEIPLDPRPDARARPLWYSIFPDDYGKVEPHVGSVPPAVEQALFFLLLAPWEDWSSIRDFQWRGFRLPWVYMIDDDLFVRPSLPPLPSSLTWETRFYENSWGDVDEVEEPRATQLNVDLSSIEQRFSESAWQRLQAALSGPLFETPVVHFLVRGFMMAGVDEVLAHLTMIEAALGQQEDYARKKDKPPASKIVSARIRVLLDDPRAGDQYKELFDWRSLYLHGRGGLAPLPSGQRLHARSLARGVAAALVEQASANLGTRADFLDKLFERGKQ